MAQPPTELMTKLRDTFADSFNEQALIDFALDLGIDYENLAGPTRKAKARELALYLWRYSLLPKLAEVGPDSRPDIDWSFLKPYLPATDPLPTPPPRTEVNYLDIQKLAPILADNPSFLSPAARKAFLAQAGVERLLRVNLDGAPLIVAGVVLDDLNKYGRTKEGDMALGRLLAYLSGDEALPFSQKQVIDDIVARYGLS